MPNWCNNVARISHENPQMIQRMIDAAESGILQEFVPCPAELMETNAQMGTTEQEQLNQQKYGYASWYDWNIANWGTKWDLCETQADRHDANNITLTFDTAWSPPIEAYGKLEELGFVIEAYYYEPGMCFCGIYEDGCENTITIEETTFDWAKDNIPRNIDEMFGIADEYAQYEAENEELDNED